jgi:hypothetical protein
MISEFQGSLFVLDDKTATSLGQHWVKSWTHRSQFTGYCWAAHQYGHPVAGAVARGIAILKTKFNHAQSIQYRAAWEIERWRLQTVRDIRRILQLYNEGFFDYNLDDSCSSYGGCPFTDACKSNHPERFLEAQFVKRVWNPLHNIKKKAV